MSRGCLVAGAVILMGCGSQVPTNEPSDSVTIGSVIELPVLESPPELLGHTGEGFADLTLFISKTVVADDVRRIEALAVHEGQQVGVLIEMPTEWIETEPIKELGGKRLFNGSVTLRPLNDLSGPFLIAVSKAYGVAIKPSPFTSEVTGEAIALRGDPNAFETEHLRLKTFFIGGEAEADPYAETVIVVDYSKRALRFEEKDQAYRADLVKMWSAQGIP